MFVIVDPRAQASSGSIYVPDGLRVLVQVKGDGVQIHTCAKTQNGQAWALKGLRRNCSIAAETWSAPTLPDRHGS